MSSNAADNGRRKVVIAPTAIGSPGVSLLRAILVPAASTVIHVAILLLAGFLFMIYNNLQAAVPEEEEPVATTQVEEERRDQDLTNTDLGMDDSVPLNYNVDRIEDVSVPGQVDVTQAAGIPDALADAPRSNVPLPPGVGSGLGSALPDIADAKAIGGMGTNFGGMGGQYLLNQFIGRSGATREKMVNEGGGNALSEQRVASGLEWLALHQAQDGHWSLHECDRCARDKPRPAGKISKCNCEPGSTHRSDVAATGFGLLPFLAGGITHRAGKTPTNKDYTKTVEGAINWLMSKQGKDGSYTSDMYAHGIASIAMCEAYGLSSDPRVKLSAQRALNFIASAQDPAGGGWRYAPRQVGDMSVTGWQLMALKSGQMSNLSVPKNVLKQAEHFLDSCESNSGKSPTGSRQGGGYGYQAGGGETIVMTSVGLLCRMYSGVGPGNPSLLAGVQKLKAVPPEKHPDVYYLYYATQVMHHMQGESWRFWNTGMDEKGQQKSKGIRDFLISK
ncbi:MAG TPA: prenyltransferase/squalene oxidase repeat-containing protein, partial [Gemmataceae bacterium]